MSIKVWDGFDHYNDSADFQARSGFLQYNLSGGNVSFVSGLRTGSIAAVKWASAATNGFLGTIVFGQRVASAFVGFRAELTTDYHMFEFWDSVAQRNQVTVFFRPDNFSIQIFRGNAFIGSTVYGNYDAAGAGTLLYTSGNNAWSPDTTYFLEIWPVIDPSAGAVTVRIGNVNVASVSGANTQASASPQWDVITLGMSSPFDGLPMDDLYYGDTTSGPGLYPGNAPIGDCGTNTLFAIGNDSVQFTPLLTSFTVGDTLSGSNETAFANQFFFASVVAPLTGVLQTTLNVGVQSGATGDLMVGLYDSDGPNGTPGTLLESITAPIVNPVAGNNAATLTATHDVTGGHTYYWGFLQSVNVALEKANAGNSTTYYAYALPYTSSLPSSVAGVTMVESTGQEAIATWGTADTSNYGNVSETEMDGDTSYNYSSTVTDEDLLNFQALLTNITLIYGVQVTGAYRKDDAGARSVKQALKSNVTEQYGTTHSLPQTYAYYTDLWILDPDTGLNWNLTGVNSLAAGYNVAA